jgi:hypothetical protein
MPAKTHIPGGTGEQAIGQAKRQAKQIAQNRRVIRDDLTSNWSSLTNAQKIEALCQQAIFSMKVQRYLLLKEFGE